MNEQGRIDVVKHAGVSVDEWAVRSDLAAAYRLAALYGWDDLIYTHFAARVPGNPDHFLLNPYGLMFDEITASSFLTLRTDGTIVRGSADLLNRAAVNIHTAIMTARPDVGCTIHLHTDDTVAVASQRHGLLPLSQYGMLLQGLVNYHDYEGIADDARERERLSRDIADRPLLILRNHGFLAAGATCAHAFLAAYFFERACNFQIRALSGGVEWNVPTPETVEVSAEQGRKVLAGASIPRAWAALIRKLDRSGCDFRR